MIQKLAREVHGVGEEQARDSEGCHARPARSAADIVNELQSLLGSRSPASVVHDVRDLLNQVGMLKELLATAEARLAEGSPRKR